MRSSTPLLAVLLALSLLAGCATRGPSGETQPRSAWDDQVPHVEALERWTLAGKVGLRTPEESTSANLDWAQYPNFYRMLISGPFGSGRNLLEGRDGRVSLTTGEGRFEANTPEALMEQQLGWSLPISALDHWVRGLPAPGERHALERDDDGFPQRLEQAGWDIEYRDWVEVDDLRLPRRLIMIYDDLRATLVVNQWRLEGRDD